MKFSESWVREWVNPAISSDELAEQITMAGLEVDGVERVAGEFSGVVVGEVVECGQHPDADKLRVTKVNIGADELLDIVCGAANCRQGLKVVVATVGAVLPGNFKIKKAKLRGQPSMGMLCAEAELGMADESDGIMELAADAPIGVDIREYLKLDDNTIEVDLTPNRSDCLGIAGLAREIGVLNNCPVTEPSWQNAEETLTDTVSVTLDAPQACPRYLARVIRGVDATVKSPLWLVEKLRRCGVRSVDPVVDVTQYVLLEFGHPMHAFDLDTIEGGIVVRMAKPEEKLTLLDGNEATLRDDTLVIADHNKALAMAGIFGGQDSGVTAESKDILLESAFFAPLAIAGKARSYGLHTDASHRYERGVDFELQRKAMERATALLLEIVGGEAGPVVEAVSEQHLPQVAPITLRKVKLEGRIGIRFEDTQVVEILTRLGLSVTTIDGGWTATVPSYRFDLAIEEDLIEEVARVYGYNNIPNVAPVASLVMNRHPEADVTEDQLKDTLVSRGYQEAITYSFVDPKVQKVLFPDADDLILPHPISADMSAMRVSLLPGLLQTLKHNQNRQQNRVRLFELGLRFLPESETQVAQHKMLAGVIVGSRFDEHWSEGAGAVDFYDAKGDVEALLANLGGLEPFSFVADSHPALHPGQCAAVYRGDNLVGHVGALHPSSIKSLGIKGKIFAFELLIEALGEKLIPKAQPVSKFPANRRDFAFVLEQAVASQDVIDLVKKVGGNQVVNVNLFDVYQGEGVAEGQKSLAISITVQDLERTLEDKEISVLTDNVITAVTSEFNATLRE
ncbi:phenylalanine--tRNA ligase subunit beta [Neiella marina]|uniref:Phenylalanine--tRNA ligase beta subunit n=1 Tax=Neiella holothuriorum TaxID=2870530 RepID=A0ABS7EJJ1_9GAMM|nr:phenylalanine--tRNA ligase subunit beta [Neiella holothuriorum]MBW8191936.1 phenylalanine--tRNA ligase subunit beta [Neiella holothuriorum]